LLQASLSAGGFSIVAWEADWKPLSQGAKGNNTVMALSINVVKKDGY